MNVGGFVAYFLAPIPIGSLASYLLRAVPRLYLEFRQSRGWISVGRFTRAYVQVKSTQGPRVKRRVSSTSDGGAESVGMYE